MCVRCGSHASLKLTGATKVEARIQTTEKSVGVNVGRDDHGEGGDEKMNGLGVGATLCVILL